MGDCGSSKVSLPARLSRRSIVRSSIAFGAVLSVPFQAHADDLENPPAFANDRHQFEMLLPRRKLPSIFLPSQDGKKVKIAGEPGKILLINFWATWCGLCRTELPMLAKVQNALRDIISVIAISTDESDPRRMAAYLQSLGIRDLKILIDSEGYLSNRSGSNKDALFPLYGIPTTYLITPSGWIAGLISGVTDWTSREGQNLLAYYLRA